MCTCSPESKLYPWLHQKEYGEEGGFAPLPCFDEIPSGVLHPALGPQHRKDMNLLEQVQRRRDDR